MSALRTLLLGLVGLLALGLLAIAPAAPATAASPDPAAAAAPAPGKAKVTQRLRALIRALPVHVERRKGYDRDRFRHWISQGGGCDTRDVVLIQEAVVAPTVEPGCDLEGGRWTSYYDGASTSNPSTFDIDHMVPLAEAWDSGAHSWSDETRERYANDLADRRTLVAVSASSNRSKSDQDPREWLPAKRQCRYIREWAAVKTRWSLTVDRREKRALRERAARCRNVRVVVRMAAVG